MNNIINRRNFIKKTTAATALTGLSSPLWAGNWKGANDRVNVALIGCKGVGWANLKSHLKVPDLKIYALCDVDQNILDSRSEELSGMVDYKFKQFNDYRKLLDKKDLDAVIIATPDHWHALNMIHACEAEKDVYVEKPLSNSIEECKTMVKAAQRYNRVVQVGQQQRSGKHWQEGISFVHSGKLGRIRNVKAWAWLDWKGEVPKLPNEPVPEGVDYEMWLGPAPKVPFNQNRFHFTWRWFWDYAGGLMTDWGVHMLDMVLFGMQAGAPNSVAASGGKYAFPDDAMQTPDTLTAVYEFDDFLMSWEHTIGLGRGPYDRPHGVAFNGSNGTLVVDRRGWEVIPEYDPQKRQEGGMKMEAVPVQPALKDDRDQHAQNFVDCIKSREKPICDIETGANVAINAHLGNIAYRLGKKVYFDNKNLVFKNDPEAAKLSAATYRAPWSLPVI